MIIVKYYNLLKGVISINNQKSNIRYNLLIFFVYIIGIILIIQLFNLQIIKGDEYREISNTRLTREKVAQASRGNIYDRTGEKLVSSKIQFDLALYKTKIDVQTLNNTIIKIFDVLQKNGDSCIDELPIKVDPFQFDIDGEELKNWKIANKIPEEYNAEESFEFFKKKFEIETDNIQDARKIMQIRYLINSRGYSSTKTVEIAKNISRESMVQISEQNADFPGINIDNKPSIQYNLGSVASHILGTVGKITESEIEGKEDIYGLNDIIGKDGIQYVFEDYLKGQDGIKQIDMAVDGTVTAEYMAKEAISGSNVVLTIDSKLQKKAEEALKNDINKISTGGYDETSDADSGAVVVMNVNTGEILAMCSYPDFEPQFFADGISVEKYSEYINSESKPLFNRAISGSYAPGSTFKMVTGIAGLEEKAITKDELINDIGVYPRGHHPVCWYYTSFGGGHGYLNVSQAIKHSCNYFFYETGYRIGIDKLSNYASYFGLGKKTGVELTGEIDGTLAKRQIVEDEGIEWYLADTLSASIGQSFNSFTPIQMAKYISMLTNGGNPIDVTIIKDIINPDGTKVSKEEINKYINEKIGKQEDDVQNLNMNRENINAILEGMKGVTSESGGTAYSTFRDFTIEVGGKTGSAQAGDKTNGWFVGFAPFDKPEIAVVVLVENGAHGGYTAEVARDIFEEYFKSSLNNNDDDIKANSNIQSLR